jgi:beta-galactosidase
MKITRHLFGLVLLSLLSATGVPANGRTIQDFDLGWLFSKGDFAAGMMPAFDDTGWQAVRLPHDWSSDGPFSADYASGNGYAPGGIGWYRKHFTLDANQANASVTLEFDGVYDYSQVWVNGQYAGGRPYGYSSFQCDLTPFVRFGDRDNVVAVRVDHSRFADSRYYTGSGIYRNVRLVVADKLHIAHWGVAITTPEVKTDSASVHVETTIENDSGTNKTFSLAADIIAPDGQVVATARVNGEIPAAGTAASGNGVQGSASPANTLKRELQMTIPNPQLWNVETPNLYRAVSRITSDGVVLDELTNTFGVREFHFDADKGFFLNGKSLKIKGVCLHHDAGPIGAAVPDKVVERRLRTLKEIGANAIRTSHNPPDPGLLDLCDRLGFLVMDEAFDEFTPGKNKWISGRNNGTPSHFGYSELFAQWSVTDLEDLVRRDRNHPGIILWSIGNEVDYANDPFSHPVLGDDYNPQNPRAENLVTCAKPLIAAAKALDPTRPVTAALATVSMSDAVGLAQLLDVDGYNYQEMRYADDHQRFPQRVIYGSENSHQYSAWLAVKTNDFIAGQFLWTGADYLGEANEWPDRASSAGLLDLCGFKKPLAWFRQSLWSGLPMVYLCVSNGYGNRGRFAALESWNWPTHSTAEVFCFANCPEITLTLNGKVIGTQALTNAERGILRWEVPYEPGTLEASGRVDGKEVCHYALQTADDPARIELLPDATQLHADGKDVCHLEFRIVDAQGRHVPDAMPEVTFATTGPGKILGLGNGNVYSTENCKGAMHAAFHGRGLAILQTATSPGDIVVKATAPGLEPASVTLQSR